MTKTLDNDANTILSFRLVFIYTRFRYTLSQSIKKNNKKYKKKDISSKMCLGFCGRGFFSIVVVHLSSVFVTQYMPCRCVCWFWFDYLSLFLAQVIRKRYLIAISVALFYYYVLVVISQSNFTYKQNFKWGAEYRNKFFFSFLYNTDLLVVLFLHLTVLSADYINKLFPIKNTKNAKHSLSCVFAKYLSHW